MTDTAPLKSKSTYTDREVATVWANITDHVTAARAEELVGTAVAELREWFNPQRLAYGWSGGKDSQALRVVCEKAGVRRSVLGVVGPLEFTAYLKWCGEHAPAGLAVFSNDDLDLAWLRQPGSQQYLFPQTANDGYFWTMAGTRRAQRLMQDLFDPQAQVYGRRTQDGNICGTDGTTRGGGILSYNPIRAWTHEETLAVCHYYDMPLPPTYDWPSGWTAGTGPWPGRRVGDEYESWRQTEAIEPEAVQRAAAAGVQRAIDWVNGDVAPDTDGDD